MSPQAIMPISDCEYDPESGVTNSVRRNVPSVALVQAAEPSLHILRTPPPLVIAAKALGLTASH